MSATGIGGERLADDFYGTPSWCVDALVGAGVADVDAWRYGRILEPSAGNGAIVKALSAHVENDRLITAIESHDGRAEELRRIHRGPVLHRDFLSQWFGYFDIVVMNPPYNDAQAHVEHALRHIAPGGVCAALLRIGFAATKKRRAFRAAHPFDIYMLATRPRFQGKEKGTDSCEYAWFVFGGDGGRFRVLEGA